MGFAGRTHYNELTGFSSAARAYPGLLRQAEEDVYGEKRLKKRRVS